MAELAPGIGIEHEFAYATERARDLGIPVPPMARIDLPGGPGLRLSGLTWGAPAPRLVLVHGGAQNAHTWTTTALRVGAETLAVDLPGHGHSDWFPDGRYALTRVAAAVTDALRDRLKRPVVLVGHSIGALSTVLVAEALGDAVHELVLLDAEPGGLRRARRTVRYQGTFDDLLDDVAPGRAENRPSLEAAVRRNAVHLGGDQWRWRWDPRFRAAHEFRAAEEEILWRAAATLQMPVLAVRGERSPLVQEDAHEAFARVLPRPRTLTAPGAGHNVHSDAPEWLAEVLRESVAGLPA